MGRSSVQVIIALLLIIAVVGCGHRFSLDRPASGEAPWEFPRGGIESKGFLPSDGFTGSLDIIWEEKTNDKPAGPLTIAEGFLIYPGAQNRIKFLELTSGKNHGYIRTKSNPQTGVTVADSMAYYSLAPRYDKLYCRNLHNRDAVWERVVKDAVSGTIIVNNRLIVVTGNGQVMALNPESGIIDWQVTLPGRFTAAPSASDGRLFLPGNDGNLYTLSAFDGKQINVTEMENALVGSVAVGEKLYCGDVNGNAYCIEPESGKIIWQRRLSYPIWTSPALKDNLVFFTNSGGELIALEATTGRTIWTFKAVEVIRASPIVCGDFVIFGTMGGKLYSVRVSDGSLMAKREVKGAVAVAPVTDGKRVYIATNQGRIVSFGQQTQSFGQADN